MASGQGPGVDWSIIFFLGGCLFYTDMPREGACITWARAQVLICFCDLSYHIYLSCIYTGEPEEPWNSWAGRRAALRLGLGPREGLLFVFGRMGRVGLVVANSAELNIAWIICYVFVGWLSARISTWVCSGSVAPAAVYSEDDYLASYTAGYLLTNSEEFVVQPSIDTSLRRGCFVCC
jgi:hypothetical protein